MENLPLDVGVHPRTGENLTLEEIYVQKKSFETQVPTLRKIVKAHEKVNERNPKPLSEDIRSEVKSLDSHMPILEKYYGKTCPLGRLTWYERRTDANGQNDKVKALTFSTSLFGESMDRWVALPRGSILRR